MKSASIQEINKAKELMIGERYEEAILELKKLNNKYPNDTVVLYELGSLLLRQKKEVSKALYYLKLATNRKNSGSVAYQIGTYYFNELDFEKAEEFYNSMLNSNDKMKCLGLHQLVKLYIRKENFKEAYETFSKLEKMAKESDYDITHFNNLKFYVYYKNNIPTFNVREDAYFNNQVTNYKKERAVTHIERHLRNMSEEEQEKRTFHSIFIEGTNVEELYNEMQNIINNMNPTGIDIVDYYKYDLGRVIGETYNNEETTFVEVVTLPGSKKILSIYPVNDAHINKLVNLLDENKEVKTSKKTKKKVYVRRKYGESYRRRKYE